ncbi:MAG: insulinase family protein [Flavobacteriales bacterium]|jgi:predicted Zn-dependent peptidase|nr:insulinase family protein [Flavobacteriales bacterium]
MSYQVYIIPIIIAAIVGCSKKVTVDRSLAPVPKPAPEINIPTPASFTLENGLKVFVVENHKLPKVSFQLTVDTDPVFENDKVGLSDLTGELMAEGTASKSKDQIDREIDFIGASLYTSANGVYLSSLRKHTDKALEIASDIMMNPSFPSEQLEKKKKQMISGLKTISTNANAIADRVSRVVCYGKNHPYGEVQLKEHVERITIQDCKEYYSTYFRPNVSYLVVVGDITLAEAKAKVQKYFGSWKRQEVPEHYYEFPNKVEENRVVFVEKPGAVQSLIQVVYPLKYEIGTPDASAVKLMTGIFGGAFSSYLNANLREDKAYTYGARGGIKPDELVGKFSASASVRNEVTDSAIVEFLAEMKHIRDEKVALGDLNRIRNNTNGSFALSLEKPQTVARFALNTARYGLPEDYYQNYLSRLDQVTIEDVQAVAKKYIKPEASIILVVGNKEVLEKIKRFDADGIVEVLDMNGDPKKELKPITNGMTAEKVLEQYFFVRTDLTNMEAVHARFKNIKDITKEMEATIQGMKIQMISKQLAPNAMSMEMKMNNMLMQKQVFDGEKGVSTSMQGVKELEGEELASFAEGAVLHKELKYKELGYQLNLLGIERVLGKDAYKLEITSPSGEVSYQYFDETTGLLIYSTSTSVQGGKAVTSTTEHGDYKKVDGILFAHKITEQIGAQLIDLSITKIQLNAGLSIADFK